MMQSSNWGEFLLPHLRRIFDIQMDGLRDFIPVIYNTEKSTKAQEFTHGIGSLGLMVPWNDSGRQVSYETIHPGFKQTYTHVKYSKGLEVERELLDDAQYPEVKKRVGELTDTVYNTRQYHAVYPFNNALSFPGPDGKPMLATDHPLSPNNSTTWSNYDGALDLNATNVELVRNRMKKWMDDKGNIIPINPDTLIVPSLLRKPAKVVSGTEKEPSTAENDINIWKGSLTVIEWDFLTDPNMWFFVDRRRMKRLLTWFDRRKPALANHVEFDNEVSKYAVIGRWSYGFDDARFVYGCRQSTPVTE